MVARVMKTYKEKRFEKEKMKEKQELDLSGSIQDCLARYTLDEEEIEEIIRGLEQGLTEQQVKTFFGLSAKKMNQVRRLLLLERKKEENREDVC